MSPGTANAERLLPLRKWIQKLIQECELLQTFVSNTDENQHFERKVIYGWGIPQSPPTKIMLTIRVILLFPVQVQTNIVLHVNVYT